MSAYNLLGRDPGSWVELANNPPPGHGMGAPCKVRGLAWCRDVLPGFGEVWANRVFLLGALKFSQADNIYLNR